MNISEYTALSLGDKADAVWTHGRHIDCFVGTSEERNLYVLNDFYVETIVLRETGRIKAIIAFRGGSHLEKYLSRVTLSELMNEH